MKQDSIEIPVSPSIFYSTHFSKARRVIHQGGQWSGKTVNILISLACHAKENTSKQLSLGDEVITITSESVPHLRSGALRDFEKYVYPHFDKEIKQYNKTDRVFSFKSGAIIEFKSFENEGAARGAKRTRLFINEANRFDWMTFFQLDSRTEVQSILDYNPTAKFWVHDNLIGSAGNELLISDHRHNPFLSEEKHNEIESIKDPELWKVYARGKTGNIIGTIYPDWKIIDDVDFPNDDNVFWGLDFGYTNDPTALVKMVKIGNTIFIQECCYTTALTPTQILATLKANGYKNEQPVYSEHDPDMVRQLRQIGILSIPTKKGPGSINAGILKVKEYNICITHSSNNIKEEQKRYTWIIDPSTGQPTNTPVDVWNHLMDAIRYGIYTHFYRGN